MKTNTYDTFDEHFEQLYARYAGRLYNYVLKLSHGNKYVAEEITQTAFMKLWENRAVITDYGTMASYLFAIARNAFFNVCEHDAIEYVYFNYILNTATIHDNSTEQQIDSTFLMEHICRLVDEMPPVRRQVFIMSRQYNMSHKQLGITVNTVETHIMLALHYLRTRLASHYGMLSALLALFITQ